MAQDGVTQSNERLFKLYEKSLGRPVTKEYVETAIKLAIWLGDVKAYYTAARPNIVNLLTTAQRTLQRAIQPASGPQVPFTPANFLHHPLAPSYARLVTAIRPFRESFVESHLQEAVTHLLQTVEGIPLESMSLSVTQDDSIRQQSLSSSTSDSVVERTDLSRSLDGAPPSRRPTGSIVQRTASAPYNLQTQGQETVSKMAVPPGSEGTRRSSSLEIIYLGSSKETTECIVHEQKATVSPASKKRSVDNESKPVGKDRPKKKKKDLSAFVKSDLQDFKRQRQARKQTLKDSAAFIKKESGVEQVTMVDHNVQQNSNLAFNGVQDQESTSLVASTKNSPMKTSSSLTVSLPLSGQVVESQITPSVDQIPAKDIDVAPRLIRNMTSQGSPYISSSSPILGRSLETTASMRPAFQTVYQAHNEPPSSSHREQPTGQASLTAVAPASDLSCGHFSVDPFMAQGLFSGSGAKQGPSSSGVEIAPAEVESEEATFRGSSISQGTKIPETQKSNATCDSSDFTSRPLLIAEDSDLGRLFKWYEEYKCKSIHSQVGDPVKDVEMTLEAETADINTVAGLVEDVATLDLQVQAPNKFLYVIAFSLGRPSSAGHEFSFDIIDPDMCRLLKWVNRSSVRLSELTSSSYCLSLGCYPALEVRKLTGNEASPDAIDDILANVVQSLPSTWPQEGGLHMNVNFSGKYLPLSPPIVITGDGLVDVSEFMVLGRNTLQIQQQDTDFSDYIFILRAHHPTVNQLQEEVENRRKEVEWKDWLDSCGRSIWAVVLKTQLQGREAVVV